jgi:uncharacterized protein with PIN domain
VSVVEVRRANKEYVCDRCGRKIDKGKMYARMKNCASPVGRPLCLDCVGRPVPKP